MDTNEISPLPNVGQSYRYGWQQMKKYFLPLLLVMLILIVAEIPTGLAELQMNDDLELEPVTSSHIVAFLYWLLVLPVFQFGGHYVNLKAARNQSFEVQEMFSGFGKYLKVVLANLLIMALVGLGLVVFIIPGIIVLCRLAFVPYLVMDQDLGPIAAVEKSWKITKGHAWNIFGMVILAIPIMIGGLLLVFVGVIFAVMWIFCSFAGFYYAVTLEERQEGEKITT